MVDGATVFATETVLSSESVPGHAVVTDLDGTTSGAAFVARAAGYAKWVTESGSGPAPIAGLVGYSANSLAFLLAASTTGTPLAPLGTRLPTDDLVGMVRGLRSTMVVYDRPNAALAHSVAAGSGAVAVDLADVADCRGERRLLLHAHPDDTGWVIHTSGWCDRCRARRFLC